MSFDGIDDYVRVPASAKLDIGSGAGLSVEFWMNPSSLTGPRAVLEWSGEPISGNWEMALWHSLAFPGNLLVRLSGGADASLLITGAGIVATGQWQHIAFTYHRGSGMGRLYRNGAEIIARQMGTVRAQTSNDLYIGSRLVGAPAALKYAGELDEVALYGRTLEPIEIAALHEAGSAGKCAGDAPPRFLTEPADLRLAVGEGGEFKATVVGAQTYHWFHNEALVEGATNATLHLPDAQLNQAGAYQVIASSASSLALSRVAHLVVEGTLSCLPPPTGLVSGWKFEGDTADAGLNGDGFLVDGAAFGPGKVGQGLSLDGVSAGMRVPASPGLDVGGNDGLTVEFWINPSSVTNSGGQPLVEWHDGPVRAHLGMHLWHSLARPGDLLADLRDQSGSVALLLTDSSVLTTGQWQHVAFTYDRVAGIGRFYRDGIPVFTKVVGRVRPQTSYDLHVGRRNDPAKGITSFSGSFDEMSIYGRALSDSEVASIHHRGSAGKCVTQAIPVIKSQLPDRTVFAGEGVELSIVAGGARSYRWFREGLLVVGQADAKLTIPQVELSQGGGYQVVLSNASGSVTSRVAQLTVLPRPPCLSAPAELRGWWRLEGNGLDAQAQSDGIVSGMPAFTDGVVGHAMVFDGVDDQIYVPAAAVLDVGASPGLTIEFWINPASLSEPAPIIEWRDEIGRVGLNVWHSIGEEGTLRAYLSDFQPFPPTLFTPGGVLTLGQWQHVAFTYEEGLGIGTFYRNGAAIMSRHIGSAHAKTMTPIYLGGAGNRLAGQLDEVSVYGRALDATEIAALYNFQEGKCHHLEPPLIREQPLDLAVFEGERVEFTVAAISEDTFQWYHQVSILPGETSSRLTLRHIRSTSAGGYHVVVANSVGSVTSRVAQLTVQLPPPCVPPPVGLVAWWRFEENLTDQAGTNVGIASGTPGFANAIAGQGLLFDGMDDHVRVPASAALDVGAADGMTIEFWIRPTAVLGGRPVVEWKGGPGDPPGVHLWHSFPFPGTIFVSLPDITSGGVSLDSGEGFLSSLSWQHVAFTYDRRSGLAQLYRNGIKVLSKHIGVVRPATTTDLYLGMRPELISAPPRFAGSLDEVSIYARALSAGEVAAIHQAANGGKCPGESPPHIFQQPKDVIVLTRRQAELEVQTIAGQTFQWYHNAVAVTGGTSAILILTNAQVASAGDYYVVVMNDHGSVTSHVAHLTVASASGCVAVPSGLVAWWPFDGDARNVTTTNHGIPGGSPIFVPGVVGKALDFDGQDDQLHLPASPDLDLGRFDGMTAEFWMNPSTLSSQPLLEWNQGPSGIHGTHFWHSSGTPGDLAVNLTDVNGQHFILASPGGILLTGVNQHVAFTYDKNAGVGKLYHNGLEVVGKDMGTIRLQTTFDLYLGVRPGGPGSGTRFAGQLDEMSLYVRALAASEIVAIYDASNVGKCLGGPPPFIIEEPQDEVVFAGQEAAFEVEAVGLPESFQWYHDGLALPGQTASTLFLTNVQAAQAGSYHVILHNDNGSITSRVAQLTLDALPPCVPVYAGLATWWRMERDVQDHHGSSPGILEGGPAFANGAVGLGLVFDGIDDYVRFPASPLLDVGAGGGFTIDFWINPSSLTGNRPILEWNSGPLAESAGAFLWHSLASPGSLHMSLAEGVFLQTDRGVLVRNQWQHVAFTYDVFSQIATFYRNGIEVAAEHLGTIRAETSHDLYLGLRPASNLSPPRFVGGLDEVSLHDRALNAVEVTALYQVNQAGKCLAGGAPLILVEPSDQVIFAGQTADFQVSAAGALTYQWHFGDSLLGGQTNDQLRITNVQAGYAGDYHVIASSAHGAVTSQVARLTVNPSPPCVAAPADLAGWWGWEGNLEDERYGTIGILQGNPILTNGFKGLGLAFDGRNDSVRLPATPWSDVGANEGMTVELWVKPASISYPQPVIEWNGGPVTQILGVHLWHSADSPGDLFANLCDLDGRNHYLLSGRGKLHAGQWHHVALTYDKVLGVGCLFVDGAKVASGEFGPLRLDTTSDLYLGIRSDYSDQFKGTLDEVSIYGRALTEAELAALHHAAVGGKCPSLEPPGFVANPQDLTRFVGQSGELRATVARAQTYQWFRDGLPLNGETTSRLSWPDLRLDQTGSYWVVAGNIHGTATSQVARLTVQPIPPCSPVPPGLVAWWPLDGSAEDAWGTSHGLLAGNPLAVGDAVGTALLFDGLDDHVRIAASAALDIGAGPGLTIELWINPETIDINQSIAAWSSETAGGGLGMYVWHSSAQSGDLFIDLQDPSGRNAWLLTDESVLQAGQWQHMAFTYDRNSGLAKLYIDGAIVVTRFLGTLRPKTTDDLYLGVAESPESGVARFSGLLDEVALYDRALEPSEVQATYEAQYGGKCRVAVAPFILDEPDDLSLLEGQPARFELKAVAVERYQWFHDGLALTGETNSKVILPNSLLSLAGGYFVIANNTHGSITSRVARLAVRPRPVCIPISLESAGWWRLDGNAQDHGQTNHGILGGNPVFTNGPFGSALLFDGVDDQVRIPASPTLDPGDGAGMSIEFWINPGSTASAQPIVEWNSGPEIGEVGLHLWHSLDAPGNLFVNLRDRNGQEAYLASPAGILRSGAWQHVVFSYDATSGMARLFHNGVEVASDAVGVVRPQTALDLYLGVRPGSDYRLVGLLDEVSLYRRPLRPAEVEGLYIAQDGKCQGNVGPVIITEPADVIHFVGQQVTFEVVALGGQTYQWFRGASRLAGAVSPVLKIPTVQFDQAGGYQVVVSNETGSVTSRVARLRVDVPPSCAQAPAGLVAWWKFEQNTLDTRGPNDGTVLGSASFGNGRVGLSLMSDGLADQVHVPASAELDLGAHPGLTIEFWIHPSSLDRAQSILEWEGEIPGDDNRVIFWHSLDWPGDIYVSLRDTNGQEASLWSESPVLDVGEWCHVAFTYDRTSGMAKLYRNGVAVMQVVTELTRPQTRYDLHLGGNQEEGGGGWLSGRLDEVSLYDRVLSGPEVQGIYAAADGGKCLAQVIGPVLAIQVLTTPLPEVVIEFTGQPDLEYIIEASDDLQHWEYQGRAAAIAGGRFQFRHGQDSARHQFFRVVVR